MATTVIGRPLGRRAMLAVTGAALTMPFIARRSLAEAKPFRISTPGPPEEWQSKSLELFKKELDAAMPGQFDVQIHYNGTLFAQGTEAMREAGIAGCGIIRLRRLAVEDELRSGKLVPVLTDWECSGAVQHVAVYRKTRPMPPQVSAFVQHLAREFQRYNVSN